MTPDATFTVTKNGKISGSGHLAPGQTFVVRTPAGDAYNGSIYASHRGHNETLALVGGGQHTIDIGKIYTVQPKTNGRSYQLTTTKPPHRDTSIPFFSEGTDAPQHTAEGMNGDLTVGSGGM